MRSRLYIFYLDKTQDNYLVATRVEYLAACPGRRIGWQIRRVWQLVRNLPGTPSMYTAIDDQVDRVGFLIDRSKLESN